MKNKTYNINGLDFKVQICDPSDERLIIDGSARVASIRPMTLDIFLISGMNKTVEKRMLIHELTHAFITANGFDAVKTFDEECVCEFIAAHAESILRIADDWVLCDCEIGINPETLTSGFNELRKRGLI